MYISHWQASRSPSKCKWAGDCCPKGPHAAGVAGGAAGGGGAGAQQCCHWQWGRRWGAWLLKAASDRTYLCLGLLRGQLRAMSRMLQA